MPHMDISVPFFCCSANSSIASHITYGRATMKSNSYRRIAAGDRSRDCCQSVIFEDVGVIKFQIVENQRVGTVMDKLGALVEDGAIVLAHHNHEEITVAQLVGDREVIGQALEQEAVFLDATKR